MATADSTVTYRDIPGFPGYRVGDDGSVWSCRSYRSLGIGKGSVAVLVDVWHRLKPGRIDKYNHLQVGLCKDGKRHNCFVHKLVLIAFVGPRPHGMECCHGDGDPTNNAITNLRWDTKVANMADRDRHGRAPRGLRNPRAMAKLSDADVVDVRLRRAAGESCVSIARSKNVDPSTISLAARRLTFQHIA